MRMMHPIILLHDFGLQNNRRTADTINPEMFKKAEAMPLEIQRLKVPNFATAVGNRFQKLCSEQF